MPLLPLGAPNVFWGPDGPVIGAASYSSSVVMTAGGPGVVATVTHGGHAECSRASFLAGALLLA